LYGDYPLSIFGSGNSGLFLFVLHSRDRAWPVSATVRAHLELIIGLLLEDLEEAFAFFGLTVRGC